ncbi:alpha/beta hydrolase [Flavicella sp.]|uniref:alpha/beta hydrolase n=1 Tax=Flavicella sp. TaxID=2957742 RepID=UPI00301832A7
MKKHIYFLPGTSANSKIFDRINFPGDQFELHFLEWLLPSSKNESIQSYSKRLCKNIKHKNPILIGVSFGGVIVQEMSKIISYDKLIIISSIKNKYELPKKLNFIKKAKLYLLAPVHFIDSVEKFISFLFGKKAQNRIDAYKMYLSQRNPKYLKWAIKEVLCWNQENSIPGIIHLHGDKDIIFPIEQINDCITIKDGSHVMIITKGKKISAILTELL